MNAYWAYGLRIHSELPCPELVPLVEGAGEPEVEIRVLPASAALETLASGQYEVGPGLFRLAVPGVGQYRVEAGCRIFIQPLPGAALDQVRLFLLGSTLGALLYQRGLFPLHGSAVETPQGAMLFVGAQGAGKSTLAAHFQRKGYRLLSDDVCAVREGPAGLEVLPALSQVRLCADAYQRLGAPADGVFHVDKFLVPMGPSYCPHPLPLRAVHVLCDHLEAAPAFTLLRGFDRLQQLLENLYRPHYLKGQATQGDLMGLAGRIAQGATLATVSRRRDPAAIDGLVDFLAATWAERFAVLSTKES